MTRSAMLPTDWISSGQGSGSSTMICCTSATFQIAMMILNQRVRDWRRGFGRTDVGAMPSVPPVSLIPSTPSCALLRLTAPKRLAEILPADQTRHPAAMAMQRPAQIEHGSAHLADLGGDHPGSTDCNDQHREDERNALARRHAAESGGLGMNSIA